MYSLTRNLGVGLGWTGSVLVILGRFLLASGNPWGFGVSILGDICWLIYGYERETTPRLDRWAAEARVFENVLASASSTVPTHASLFTGLLPSEHGSHAGHQWLDEDLDTLAERLRAAGYRTLAISGNPNVNEAFGFGQGFDFFRSFDAVPFAKLRSRQCSRPVSAASAVRKAGPKSPLLPMIIGPILSALLKCTRILLVDQASSGVVRPSI